jgi:exosortase
MPPFLTSSRLRPHTLFAIFGLASIALFWVPLRQLVSLSLDDRRYSHLVLIPVISAFFLYRERHKIFSRIAFRPGVGLPYLAASLAMYGLLALRVVHASSNYSLSIVMLAIVLVWAAGFAVCYGVPTFRTAAFPLLLLLLLVPIPFDLMDKIVSVLQRGSAEATYALFRLAGVPMFRDGVRFELPGIGIEIAEECSSIHSSWALFITGLLLAHLFLKSIWTKVCLSILTVPIAMLTNAVRIVTIWFLGTKVDVGFLYGNLHRNGGILFSLISLSILMGFLFLLRKLERQGHRARSAGEGPVSVMAPPGGQAATLP